MTLAAFIARYLGQAIDIDGVDGAQCVDLVNAWATLGKGKPRLQGNAYELLAKAPPGTWQRTANTPTNFPIPGAIVVWSADVPAVSIGPYGHTAIALVADIAHLVTLDQNWDGKMYAVVNVHPYAGVAGWLTAR
jgi:hypothetical protein